jgi:hypothetical protein
MMMLYYSMSIQRIALATGLLESLDNNAVAHARPAPSGGGVDTVAGKVDFAVAVTVISVSCTVSLQVMLGEGIKFSVVVVCAVSVFGCISVNMMDP